MISKIITLTGISEHFNIISFCMFLCSLLFYNYFFFIRCSDILAFLIVMLDIKLLLVTGILVRKEEPKLLLHVNGEQTCGISSNMLFMNLLSRRN